MKQFSGALLRKHREAAGMSQMDLARAIDFRIGPQQLGRYERGEQKNISLNLAGLLAKTLNVGIKDLVDHAAR
jgi:transcriptional regulator with XRE-family HTH domain